MCQVNVSYDCLLKIGERVGISGRWHSTCAHTRARVASKKSLKSDVLPKGKICLVTKRVISIPQIFYAFSLSQLLYGTLAFPLGGYEHGNLKPENIRKVDSVMIVCNLTRPISTFSVSARSVCFPSNDTSQCAFRSLVSWFSELKASILMSADTDRWRYYRLDAR